MACRVMFPPNMEDDDSLEFSMSSSGELKSLRQHAINRRTKSVDFGPKFSFPSTSFFL